jgi:type IX secretion system PorP/SprF family membrane protein
MRWKTITAIGISYMSMTVAAQQLPVRTTAMLNPFQDNPALAGSVECLDLHFGQRAQWAGFDGAPTTSFVNIHGQMVEQGPNFHGLGGRVESDEAGPWGHLAVNLAYAYNLKMTSGARLAAGFSAGLYQFRLNQSMIDLPDVEVANDPAFQGESAFVFPSLDVGLALYERDWFVGLSLINATGASLGNIGAQSEFKRHFALTANAKMELYRDWSFRPSAQVRIAPSVPASADLMLALDYNDIAGFGLGYRTGTALLAMAKVKVLDYLSIGYAYGLTTSVMRAASANSHEVIIGINACGGNSRGRYVSCPAYD